MLADGLAEGKDKDIYVRKQKTLPIRRNKKPNHKNISLKTTAVFANFYALFI